MGRRVVWKVERSVGSMVCSFDWSLPPAVRVGARGLEKAGSTIFSSFLFYFSNLGNCGWGNCQAGSEISPLLQDLAL